MGYQNLREFIAFLESKNEIHYIDAPVSRDLEITEITDRAVKSGGPALYFRNVEGFTMPIVTNLFGTHQRMALALGVDSTDDLTQKVRDILGIVKTPPESLFDKLKTLKDMASIAKTQPKTVSSGPCQEVVKIGHEADLNFLPHLKCWPDDGGRFITMPLVISRDPITGKRNVGTYRMQVYDSNTAGMHWQSHKVGASHYRSGELQELEKMEVAVTLGSDPTTMWTGALPLPPDMDEIAVSGVVSNSSVKMVKCKTIDLEVPSNSEVVLEGYVIPGELKEEGPFGDHTGYYSLEDDYPVFHLTAITHKKDPIYPATVVGRPPSEDYFMGKAVERLMLPALQLTLPEIVDINMPAEGVFHNLVIVSMKKEYPGHTRKVMNAIWGLGLMMLAKGIIIVDDNVNVQDLSEVAWRVSSNINPDTDLVVTEGPVDDLDHSSPTPKYGSKLGIDATKKTEMDGRKRTWPPDVIMSDEMKSYVSKRWTEYGFQ
ncbi:MAG: menaquinone biosynthesis decarboxylase [Chloroflexota bacterium]|nr:menaquinone biosynthesis decarboxylase [Chloroflexota bacterium]